MFKVNQFNKNQNKKEKIGKSNNKARNKNKN